MQEYDIPTLAAFFATYESKNQELPEYEVISRMHTILDAMRGALREGLEHPNRTPSRMIDGGAAHMGTFIQAKWTLLGAEFIRLFAIPGPRPENNAHGPNRRCSHSGRKWRPSRIFS